MKDGFARRLSCIIIRTMHGHLIKIFLKLVFNALYFVDNQLDWTVGFYGLIQGVRRPGLYRCQISDAHELVKELTGPFDFVFCDVDKDWYTQYFIDIYPKLKEGGCYTAHNVTGLGYGQRGTNQFYEYWI